LPRPPDRVQRRGVVHEVDIGQRRSGFQHWSGFVYTPPPLPDITRGTTLKVLGVTFTNTMSASVHVLRVISDSAQSLYALRVLRRHGLDEAGLQTVFRAVVVSRQHQRGLDLSPAQTNRASRRSFAK